MKLIETQVCEGWSEDMSRADLELHSLVLWIKFDISLSQTHRAKAVGW